MDSISDSIFTLHLTYLDTDTNQALVQNQGQLQLKESRIGERLPVTDVEFQEKHWLSLLLETDVK